MHRLTKTFLCFICICSIATAFLTGCGEQDEKTGQIKIGTIAGPETVLMEIARDIMQEEYGIKVKIVEFSDYVMPNIALIDGSINANVFQHQPYLDATIEARGYKLVAIGKTFVYPMGIYSKKIKSLAELADKSIVAIPNDPSNEARALVLLEKAGLIKLNIADKALATPMAISENSKQLRFKSLDSAQLPRALDDVALAVINTNYAIPAKLLPSRDAIFLEKKDSLYANIVVVRKADADNPILQKLVLALQSQRAKAKAAELFAGEAIPAW